jgi:hypothetical protein
MSSQLNEKKEFTLKLEIKFSSAKIILRTHQENKPNLIFPDENDSG